MTVEQKIKDRVSEVYQANAPEVYKGNDYDGSLAAHGWWYRPFNRSPIFLGASLAEALEMLAQVEDADEL